MVLDTLLHQWVSVLAEEEGKAGTEGFCWDMQRMKAYLYGDGKILSSIQEEIIQRAFGLPTDIFDQVGM